MRVPIIAVLGMIVTLALVGCSDKQSAQFAKIESDVKTGVQVADESLAHFNAVIQVAAPNSQLAKSTAQATVTAQKVNGVVQNVTITVPVVPTATVAVPVPAPVVAPASGQ